jgi:enoyl-[acyl-carrier protein] reductase I
VRPLAKSIGSPRSSSSATSPGRRQHRRRLRQAEKVWGKLDFVVHAIAFSNKDELKGRYLDTTPGQFRAHHGISCYSFTAVAQRAVPLMKNGGSLLTLTYYGAERVMPHYNVMGVAKAALEASVRYLAADLGEQNIRVNAISAGPIKTLAASGIGDFRYILKWNELQRAAEAQRHRLRSRRRRPLPLSDLATGVTGEVHHVDCGYHVVGMMARTSPRSRSRDAAELRTRVALRRRPHAGNTFGTLFRVTTWGESHGPAIGCVVDGCPPGIPLTEADIQPWLDKRRPGQSRFVTQRQEPDAVKILSGVFEGRDHRHADLAADRQCRPARSKDYGEIATVPAGPCRLHL